jgi:hypothetical protein
MDHLKHPGKGHNQANAQENEPKELVCSPEFTSGCADPTKGMPPELAPGAPIEAVQPRPNPHAVPPEAGAAPASVQTHNAAEQPEEGFPEIACSWEFPTGCMNPSDEDMKP